MCVAVPNHSVSYTLVVFFTQFVVPLTVMSVCYLRIVKIARRHVRRICDMNIQVQNQFPNNSVPKGHITNNGNINTASILAFALVDQVKTLSLFPEFATCQNLQTSGCYSEQRARIRNQPVESNVNFADFHSSGCNGTSTRNNLRKEAKATIKLLGLVLAFLCSWIQIHIVNLLSLSTVDINRTWHSFAFLLACSSSCCNPIIYVLASRRFRQNLRNCPLFRHCPPLKKCRKKREATINRTEKQMTSIYGKPKHRAAVNHQTNFCSMSTQSLQASQPSAAEQNAITGSVSGHSLKNLQQHNIYHVVEPNSISSEKSEKKRQK